MEATIINLDSVVSEFLKTKLHSINWNQPKTPLKWSNKEIIGHLIDSAQINLQRFVCCTYEQNFKLVYEQNAWVTAQRYHEADHNELLNLWMLLNRQIVRVLKDYPADRLIVMCDNSKTEPDFQTVQWLAKDYVEHLMHHLNQIN